MTSKAGSAKKRSYNEAMASGYSQRESSEPQYASSQFELFWQQVDRLRSQPAAYNSGKLLKVTSQKLLGALTLCRAQLFCLEHLPGEFRNDTQHLIKVLS